MFPKHSLLWPRLLPRIAPAGNKKNIEKKFNSIVEPSAILATLFQPVVVHAELAVRRFQVFAQARAALQTDVAIDTLWRTHPGEPIFGQWFHRYLGGVYQSRRVARYIQRG